MELSFLKTEKGKNVLVHNGYTLTKEKYGADSEIIWKCSQYASKKCPGRCHTQSNNVVWDPDNHTHLPEASRLAAIQFISEIKENVTTYTSTSASVLASASKELERKKKF
ncbi:uncharacterized protein LOC132943916 [Metopolophium dirhodum]|uniref:uncharacterized protein LOC132943916 n=1 Tax=Metopolophium dirhodum TaxID=44670 RepID=UPI00298F70DD|nr:uncharacterized protein LOC132943916 [Metopolophium dirhodum]